MKKIISMLALGVACSASAANFIWGNADADILDTAGAPWSGTVYLMDSNTQGAQAFLTAWVGGTAFGDLTAGAVNSASYNDYALSAPAQGTATADDEISWSDATYATGATSFYQVALVGDNLYISDAVDVPVKATGSTFVSGFENNEAAGGAAADTSGTYAGAGWYAAAATPTPGPTPGVPEPTSGLLLVVGGAMLALRRRR